MKKSCSVVLAINEKKQVLALKRGSKTRSFPGKWNFPGGKVEDGETIGEAASREILEEGGLTVVPSDLLYINTMEHGSSTIHFFMTDKFSGEVKINDESTDFKWIKPAEALKMDFIPLDNKFIKDVEYYMEILNATN